MIPAFEASILQFDVDGDGADETSYGRIGQTSDVFHGERRPRLGHLGRRDVRVHSSNKRGAPTSLRENKRSMPSSMSASALEGGQQSSQPRPLRIRDIRKPDLYTKGRGP